MSKQALRVIDASLNRIGEGLRFLEDIARLMLDDADLTGQLKTLRHDLVRGDYPFQRALLLSRSPESDVGVDIEVPGEVKEKELPLVLVANSRRVQEALRTLEELAKVPEIAAVLDSAKFKQARFALYTVEQKLVSRLLRRDKSGKISGLYVIIDTAWLKGRSHIELACQAIRGGAAVIQLRDRLLNRQQLLATAREMKALCAENNVLFIVNDYLDVALESEADGLHLGQDDLPLPTARRLLPLDTVLGCSVATVEQAVVAEDGGADYIAVSAVFPTPSKEGVEAIGLEGLREIRRAVSRPLVAIGGINKDNAPEVIKAGAESVAVISAVLSAESPETAARQIVECLEMVE